jgi:hypothetical protein
MTTFLIIFGVYVFWTISGIAFFLKHMGDKYRKARWYDDLLMLPVIPICYIIGWLANKKVQK